MRRSRSVLLSLLCVVAACEQGSSAPAPERPAAFDGAYGRAVPVAPQILVDQFGYLPGAAKVAVIRSPRQGFDRDQVFAPGARYQLRRADDGAVVLEGGPRPWNGGTIQASSGDVGWWFDFSAVTRVGRYLVYDVERNLRSPTFSIDPVVYRPILRTALRTFFYQRSGMAKTAPHAEACWTDAAAYLGPDQDGQAHDVSDRGNAAKVRDLSGGWFDAGDTNKYVTFAAQPVHQLLTAYQNHPVAFTDDTNIPESGNGIPDLIDEVKWEMDWLKKMQFDSGDVALKVGGIKLAAASPPSSDKSPRFYVPACTSATIAAAGMFAHAAYVFAGFPPLATYAADLGARAVRAWDQYQKKPVPEEHCDTGIVQSGNADWSAETQAGYAAEAAAYLFALTRDERYQTFFKANYRLMHPYRDVGWSRYQADQGEALLFYASQVAGADTTIRRAILEDKQHDIHAAPRLYGFHPDDDLYRAYLEDAQYHWGSNNPRANYGNSNLDAMNGAAPQDAEGYRLRALETLHYFHGVNPLGMTYLTNMYALGATRAANEVFHSWYLAGTKWSDARTSACGPAPGFVPGGPNGNAAKDGVAANVVPPVGQPLQKAYKDFNAPWPESSWTITEPAIYYQAAYIKLLSAFVD